MFLFFDSRTASWFITDNVRWYYVSLRLPNVWGSLIWSGGTTVLEITGDGRVELGLELDSQSSLLECGGDKNDTGTNWVWEERFLFVGGGESRTETRESSLGSIYIIEEDFGARRFDLASWNGKMEKGGAIYDGDGSFLHVRVKWRRWRSLYTVWEVWCGV